MSRKVRAPASSNITTELWSFLGITQYYRYAKVIDGYSTLTNPLNVLLQTDIYGNENQSNKRPLGNREGNWLQHHF